MMKRSVIPLLLVAAVLLSGVCLADSGGSGATGTVTGVIAVTPVQDHTCVAMHVPLNGDQALSGLKWYNNDAMTSFPRVLLASGGDSPAALASATEVATSVAGSSSGWSEVTFAEPVTSGSGSLYVIFELPAFHEQTGLGEGGGPGIGYRAGQLGLFGWLSADGQIWVRLHPDVRLAAEPVFVERQSGMMTMSASSKAPDTTTPDSGTALLAARPNPFNPRTQLAFTLRNAGWVQVGIYNVRGALVRRLVDGDFTVGAHSVTWQGDDLRGQACPSGVYFARLQADGVVMTQRLSLVR